MALSFDTTYYYRERPDVLTAWLNSDRALSPQEFALAHYNEFGWKEGYNPNEVFDTNEYLEANQDVAAAGVNPFTHYNEFGQAEGRAPNADFPALEDFDWEAYVDANPDLQAAGINTAAAAYDHYITFGWNEERPGAPDNAEFKLKKALENLQAAEQAVADFVEENEDVDGALVALKAQLDDAPSDAQLGAAVTQANADLSDAQDAVDAVEGLSDAAAALTSAQEAYVAAVKAGLPAMIALHGEVASFIAVNGLSLAVSEDSFGNVSWGDLAGLEPGTAILTLGDYQILIVGENGQLEFAEANDEFDPAALLGASQLLEDGQAAFDAAVAYAAARETFEEAIHNFVLAGNPDFDLESFDGDLNDFYVEETGELTSLFESPSVGADEAYALYEALRAAQDDLAEAEAAVAARAELRGEIAEAQALVDALETLREGVTAAEEAIEGLGYSKPVVVAGTADGDDEKNDIFVFGGENDVNDIINNFGEGDLLFIGNNYSAITVADDADLDGKADFGSLTGLDIFLQQDGNDTLVYVELETYDGHLNGDWAGETIRLVGVDAGDLTFQNGALRYTDTAIA
ncbi:hypothetical protein [Aerobium aerolatum]|uniref:Hemolysin-type calcium-binding repeat-containing protein n=1 Tax=Aquamicrobium aerolatum DSM 21857 TaxID=1121003 RepID=A0A1I3SW11_9HYPH|nr:hypothetical protein [Aquamicrobium aerolatum]SFJ62975.1 hypothetical protein SAMN03080618_03494 [Aquamicrobium aerolatum DSM 21857]